MEMGVWHGSWDAAWGAQLTCLGWSPLLARFLECPEAARGSVPGAMPLALVWDVCSEFWAPGVRLARPWPVQTLESEQAVSSVLGVK